jgi:hypothetical protein
MKIETEIFHPLDTGQLVDIRRETAARPHLAPANTAFLLRLLDEALSRLEIAARQVVPSAYT